jgi:hypothetical protein
MIFIPKQCYVHGYVPVLPDGIHNFKPKIPSWVSFVWHFLWPFCLFYCQMVYFMASWYNLLPFGIFSPVFGKFGQRKIWQPWHVHPLSTWKSLMAFVTASSDKICAVSWSRFDQSVSAKIYGHNLIGSNLTLELCDLSWH